MPCTFSAVFNPPPHLIDAIAAVSPENPFYTPEYLDVRRKLGSDVCSLTLESSEGVISGCFGFLSRGRLNSRLEITSLPVLVDRQVFWDGLFGFCSEQKISVVSAQTFASTKSAISREKYLVSHERRSEFRIDLTKPDLWKMMNRRSRRLIDKARSNGLSIRRSKDANALAVHADLANLTLNRLRERGKSIDSKIELSEVNAFIELGAGELIQAFKEDKVHATLIIARSQKGAYAQTSGSSEIAREVGASHFLFYETACLLKSEGLSVFNIGGVDDNNKGLQEFKLGLGAEKIELESAEFFIGNVWKRFATGAINAVRNTARRS